MNVKLLTAEEVAGFRNMLGGEPGEMFEAETGLDYFTVGHFSRVVATLEALQEAAAERDTWKAEAEDQRAAVERLQGEVEVLQLKLAIKHRAVECLTNPAGTLP